MECTGKFFDQVFLLLQTILSFSPLISKPMIMRDISFFVSTSQIKFQNIGKTILIVSDEEINNIPEENIKLTETVYHNVRCTWNV